MAGPPDPPPPPNPSGIAGFPPGAVPETRYAIVKGDTVVGLCFAVLDRYVPDAPPEQGVTIIQSDTAEVGWIYDGESLFPPVPPAQQQDAPAAQAQMMDEERQRAIKTYGGKR